MHANKEVNELVACVFFLFKTDIDKNGYKLIKKDKCLIDRTNVAEIYCRVGCIIISCMRLLNYNRIEEKRIKNDDNVV